MSAAVEHNVKGPYCECGEYSPGDEACQVRFYIGSDRAIAAAAVPQIPLFVAGPENALDKIGLHSNCPGAVAAARGATQEVETPMCFKGATCSYCSRRVASNRKPFVKRGYFANGSDFVGHRSCFLEMRDPESERFGHGRHDIREPRS